MGSAIGRLARRCSAPTRRSTTAANTGTQWRISSRRRCAADGPRSAGNWSASTMTKGTPYGSAIQQEHQRLRADHAGGIILAERMRHDQAPQSSAAGACTVRHHRSVKNAVSGACRGHD
jgi:hypothetical protein